LAAAPPEAEPEGEVEEAPDAEAEPEAVVFPQSSFWRAVASVKSAVVQFFWRQARASCWKVAEVHTQEALVKVTQPAEVAAWELQVVMQVSMPAVEVGIAAEAEEEEPDLAAALRATRRRTNEVCIFCSSFFGGVR